MRHKSMKPKCEWVMKAQKRKKKLDDRGIVDFIKVQKHFFKDFNTWIGQMTDPRSAQYITYTQQDLVWLGLLKNVCGVESMRGLNENFNEDTCINTLSFLSDDDRLEELPDFTTLNNYLERLSPACLSDVRREMVKSLIRSKVFLKGRIQGKYWPVVLDGTGLFYFKEKHCTNCLVKTTTDEEGKKHKTYYHKVLEAKLILSESIVISLGTEFIENEREDVKKQDCENAAAKRLLERLKKEYPRLQICVQGDGLYGVEPLMKLCRKYGWKYLFTLKEGTQRNIAKDYWDLDETMRHVKKGICAEKGKGGFYNGMEEITGKEETFNVIEYGYEKKEDGKPKQVSFLWVTNLKVTERNLEELVRAGRRRWKIENEGFNNQKNGIYKIEHLSSRNTNAMKNHYLLTQIADILMQVYLASNKLVKEIGQSIKNTSSRLMESFRRQPITDEDVCHISKYTTVHLE